MLLVTGGAGFIGSHFLHQFQVQKRADLVCLDALTYAGTQDNFKGLNPEKFQFVHGDIRDEKLVILLLEKYRPKAIVHFAAETHVDRSISGPQVFLDTNIMGTFNLLRCADAYFKRAKPIEFRFIHISTDEVFGSLSLKDPAFTEESRFEPNSPYSASKAAADHFVRAFHHTYGLPTITINCSNNFGPRQYPEKLIPVAINKALSGQKIPIYGQGLNIRDWLFVEDFARAILLILDKGRIGETYNVGGGNELTNIQVVDNICDILDKMKPKTDGSSYRVQKEFVKDRAGHDFRYAINFEKLQSELGWKPTENFETGLTKTISWQLQNSHG